MGELALIKNEDQGKFLPMYEEVPEHDHTIDPSLQEGMRKKVPYYIESLSKNSQEAFKYDMAVYMTWCKKNRHCALPAHPLVMRKFIIQQHADKKAPTTIQRRLSTINKLHKILGLTRPGEEPEVVSALKNIQEYSEHEVRQAQPFRESNLTILGSVVDKNSIRDVRDLAITALAYSTLLRRSEVAKLEVGHIEFDSEGDAVVEVKKIKSKKGNKDIHYAYLTPFATFWVKRWLKMSGVAEGLLFRSMTKHGTLRRRGLTGQMVAMSINRMGLLIDEDFHFTGHSTRVGAAQDMVASGVETTKAMNAGRWKDHKTFMRYVARLSAKENGMAELHRKKSGQGAG
ncbi:MAG: tyrosine-type recombinase/integrase [Methyloprofundus sp.]|nr:tyrosine-type recombinase/integrase [Methyloprofundus sp.]